MLAKLRCYHYPLKMMNINLQNSIWSLNSPDGSGNPHSYCSFFFITAFPNGTEKLVSGEAVSRLIHLVVKL